MRRGQKRYYVYLILFVFFVWNVPKETSQNARFICISALSPGWETCRFIKENALLAFFSPGSVSGQTGSEAGQLEALKRENHLLRMQLDNVKEWLLHGDRIEEQIRRLHELGIKGEEKSSRAFYKRRQEQLLGILKLQVKALPAKIVYREPCSWSSFLWVNVGEKNNELSGEVIVAKNSPVVIGNVLVGVVEEVGATRSKIRLITDSKLVPSVRAVRGSEQNQFVADRIKALIHMLETREELFLSKQEAGELFTQLQKVSSRTGYFSEDLYLAKGEIFGSSQPLWRGKGQSLRGAGFNYDFADEEGPGGGLRTGTKDGKSPVILEEGDLLVTTGFDGVFLPGFAVATVSRVGSLPEGGSSYEIKAEALVENFNELETVFILPPLTDKI